MAPAGRNPGLEARSRRLRAGRRSLLRLECFKHENNVGFEGLLRPGGAKQVRRLRRVNRHGWRFSNNPGLEA